jgi:hypothetical protein
VSPALVRVLVAISLVAVLFAAPPATSDSNPYLEAGIPATDRLWAGPDYERAAAVLQTGAVPMPLYSDPDGADVLNRLFSVENFSLSRNESLPIEPRLNDIQSIASGMGSIMKLYIAAANRGENPHAEAVGCMAFMLHVGAEMILRFDEFVSGMPDFESQPNRVEGRRIFRRGIATLFSGAEISLSETFLYAAEDISLLLQAMADTLPVLKTVFSDDFREEIKIKLVEDRDRMSDPADIANINRMLQELATP